MLVRLAEMADWFPLVPMTGQPRAGPACAGSGVAGSDDDLAAGVALFQVADGLGGLAEG